MGMNINGISALSSTAQKIALETGGKVGNVEEDNLLGKQIGDTVEISNKPAAAQPTAARGRTKFGKWLRETGDKIVNFFKGIWDFFFKREKEVDALDKN